jgi:hypothetical protein
MPTCNCAKGYFDSIDDGAGRSQTFWVDMPCHHADSSQLAQVGDLVTADALEF